MTVSPYSPIQAALKAGKPFTLSEEGEVIRSSHQDRSRFQAVGSRLVELLQNEPRVDATTALDSAAYKTMSRFLQTVPQSEEAVIAACKKEKLAYSLGISAKVLDLPENAGFATFAEKPPLAPYLSFYGDRLEIRDDQIFIRHQEEMKAWTEVKDCVQPPTPSPKQHQPWTYGQKGAQYKDTFNWEKLEPYRVKTIPTQETPSYEFKICACVKKTPQFGGDHTWVELVCREGDKETTISFGLFSPYGEKKGVTSRPLRVKPGSLMSPDFSRFYRDYEFHEIVRPITKEQRDRIISMVEQQKAKEKKGHPIPIQLIGDNCTRYAQSLAEFQGIPLPPINRGTYSLLNQNMGYPFLGTLAERIRGVLPGPLRPVMDGTSAALLNCTLIAYGAGGQDARLNGTAIPHFSNPLDIFDLEKTGGPHPWGVRDAAIQEKEAARRAIAE